MKTISSLDDPENADPKDVARLSSNMDCLTRFQVRLLLQANGAASLLQVSIACLIMIGERRHG